MVKMKFFLRKGFFIFIQTFDSWIEYYKVSFLFIFFEESCTSNSGIPWIVEFIKKFSPRKRNPLLRGNTIIVGWKLSFFEIFCSNTFFDVVLSKKTRVLYNETKGFDCKYLKVYKKVFLYFSFKTMAVYDDG